MRNKKQEKRKCIVIYIKCQLILEAEVIQTDSFGMEVQPIFQDFCIKRISALERDVPLNSVPEEIFIVTNRETCSTNTNLEQAVSVHQVLPIDVRKID